MKYEFPVTRTTAPKARPNEDELGFGKYFTDHMFVMNYEEGRGWHDGRIVPYEKFKLEPAARVFHYGQEMFEGIKAYPRENGVPVVFRTDKYVERAHISNDRMCIPDIETELMTAAINQLVDVDRDWIPKKEGNALYIRPFIIATEPKLSVGPANSYIFAIILSPVASYYEEGLKPTKIYVEHEYIRSVLGGPGYAKVGGNYASTLISVKKAADAGFSQVLWLDGAEKKYIEEIGTSNAFFIIDDVIYTAPLEGTVLPGVTRDSAITLLNEWGYTVKEEMVAIEDFWKAYQEGRVKEVFATGTAAVVSSVGQLQWLDHEMIINNGETGPVSQRLYDELTGIHTGRIEDTHGWIQPVR